MNKRKKHIADRTTRALDIIKEIETFLNVGPWCWDTGTLRTQDKDLVILKFLETYRNMMIELEKDYNKSHVKIKRDKTRK